MKMNETYKFLKKNTQVNYVSTINEGKPSCRPFLGVKALKQYMNYHKKAVIMKEQKINTNLIQILGLKIVKIILK